MIKKTKLFVEGKTIPAHEIDLDIYVCDLCSAEYKDGHRLTVCCLCNRHICHYRYNDKTKCSFPDLYSHDDYEDKYCSICYDLKFNLFSTSITEMEDRQDQEKCILLDKIRTLSLEKTK